MKNAVKTPRILKIKSVQGFTVSCIFNNGETRHIDFGKLFKKWKMSKKDHGYKLQNEEEFKKVGLRNNTLSWKNIRVKLVGLDGKETSHPYEIDPVVLYKSSVPAKTAFRKFYFGSIIKRERIHKGLSQEDLASLSGTSKTYISRIENDKIEPELHTLHKIVEIGLGKKIQVKIV